MKLRKQINSFISLFYLDTISSKRYEDGALYATSDSIFSKNFFEKIQVYGAAYALFPYILDSLPNKRPIQCLLSDREVGGEAFIFSNLKVELK